MFYRDIVNSRPCFCVQPGLVTSSFTVTGDNLAWTDRSQREWDNEMKSLPWYVSGRHGVAYRVNNLLRRIADARCEAPHSYTIYMPGGETREERAIKCPTAHWGMRTVSSEP